MLELPAVQDKPALFSTALMWLLAELFEELPEVGDLDKPKLVFFFDEAHLLFDGATDAFLDSVAQTVRLIRSKGVGVFFVTQIPDRCARRRARPARQPRPARAARVHPGRREGAEGNRLDLPESDFYDLDELLTQMGIGEAAVTILSETGVPTPVVHTRMLAPASRMAPADDIDGRPRRRRCTRSTGRASRQRARARSSPRAWKQAAAPEAKATSPKAEHKEAAKARAAVPARSASS